MKRYVSSLPWRLGRALETGRAGMSQGSDLHSQLPLDKQIFSIIRCIRKDYHERERERQERGYIIALGWKELVSFSRIGLVHIDAPDSI